MEQLIIFLLFVVGSIISSVVQHKKKQAEARRAAGLDPAPPRPQPPWPKTAGDWQEQLRRMLEGQAPPPVIKPILLPPLAKPAPKRTSLTARREVSEGDEDYKSPLATATAAYNARATTIQASVEKRMRGIDQQTTLHRPTLVGTRGRFHSQFVQGLRRNPKVVREAFIASIIFAPPRGLESGGWDATQ